MNKLDEENLSLYRKISALETELEKYKKEADVNHTQINYWRDELLNSNVRERKWLDGVYEVFRQEFEPILPYQHEILHQCFDSQFKFLLEKFKESRQVLQHIHWLLVYPSTEEVTLDKIKKIVKDSLSNIDEQTYE